MARVGSNSDRVVCLSIYMYVNCQLERVVLGLFVSLYTQKLTATAFEQRPCSAGPSACEHTDTQAGNDDMFEQLMSCSG